MSLYDDRGPLDILRRFAPGTRMREAIDRVIQQGTGALVMVGWDAAAGTGIAVPFSRQAFGHTGFTGTSLWVDPQRDLYVVLLTNRVNPTRARTGIGELRRRVHELAVEAAPSTSNADAGYQR